MVNFSPEHSTGRVRIKRKETTTDKIFCFTRTSFLNFSYLQIGFSYFLFINNLGVSGREVVKNLLRSCKKFVKTPVFLKRGLFKK